MPLPYVKKIAKKIKSRKQFQDVSDPESAAERYAEKKWKESEAIVKKQYGTPKKAGSGKFYGTLTKIFKNKVAAEQVDDKLNFKEFVELNDSMI